MSSHSTRFPPILPSDETEIQKECHANAEKMCLELFGPNFELKDEDGALIGPFAFLLYVDQTNLSRVLD
jgi:hypothetical protein